MESWAKIAKRIKLECPTGVVNRPSEADLVRYETEAGFKFPLDYRRFALDYGSGTLAGSYEFRFYTPSMTEDGVYSDLDPPGGCNSTFSGYTDEELAKDYNRDPAQLRRMVIFCAVGDYGDSFAWGPAEVTDPATNDMAIYLLGSAVRAGVWRVASTFREFVVDYLLRGRYGREAHPNYARGENHWDVPGKFWYFHVPREGSNPMVEPRDEADR
jgi:hypothetical protein